MNKKLRFGIIKYYQFSRSSGACSYEVALTQDIATDFEGV